MKQPMRCPTGVPAGLRPGEDYLPGCGSKRLSRPDHEELVDCNSCGIWFNPSQEYGEDWEDRYYIEGD